LVILLAACKEVTFSSSLAMLAWGLYFHSSSLDFLRAAMRNLQQCPCQDLKTDLAQVVAFKNIVLFKKMWFNMEPFYIEFTILTLFIFNNKISYREQFIHELSYETINNNQFKNE
jgi:hypothetical protein